MAQTSFHQKQVVTTSPEYAIKIKRMMMILLHRRSLIAGVSGMTLLITVFLAILAKPTYQSSMQMLVSSNAGKDENTKKEDIDFSSQFHLMLSSQLINRAVNLLYLANSQVKAEDIKGNKIQASPLKIVRLNNEFGRQQEEIFDFTYQADNSYQTKQVLEILQQVYQEYNSEQKQEEKAKITAVVNQQLAKSQQDIRQAEKVLQNFYKKHNFIDLKQQSKLVLEKLRNTQKQIQDIRIQLRNVQVDSQNLQQQLSSPLNSIFSAANLSQSQILINELKKTEIALAKERIRYTENSPVVQKLVEQQRMQMSLLKQDLPLSADDKKLINSSQDLMLSPSVMTAMNLKITEQIIQLKSKSSELVNKERNLVELEKQLKNQSSEYFQLLTEENRLKQDIYRNQKSWEELLKSQKSIDTKVEKTGFTWKILDTPERGVPIGNNKLSFLIFGMIIAPILGILAALCGELYSEIVYSTQELQKLTNLRLLGKIPKFSLVKKTKYSVPKITTLFVDSPHHLSNLPAYESIDIAYQNIQVINSLFTSQSLMITSAGTDEGKSSLVLGFAASAVRMHQKVLIIDTNWYNPTLHQTLNLSNDWGLSLLLVDEEKQSFQDYIQPIHPAIDVLTAGLMPEDSLTLLSSNRMKELLDIFDDMYDVILIDAPPILKSIDARILATLSKSIIMVEQMGRVTRGELQEAIAILDQHNLIGAIAILDQHNLIGKNKLDHENSSNFANFA